MHWNIYITVERISALRGCHNQGAFAAVKVVF